MVVGTTVVEPGGAVGAGAESLRSAIEKTEARILATTDLARLDTGLDRVVTASSLEEVPEP